ncbi:hypothetical protein CVT26_015472 [Gymnopilus dilepis]|uniref:Uncharacterized protein n=1 Tax=Gymnopilus dilepis TaxID=231916 RepID=A0A409WA83_9AGAR|nr:hypothetical protein CVT26_015472 [Gymnopilus dilepis]
MRFSATVLATVLAFGVSVMAGGYKPSFDEILARHENDMALEARGEMTEFEARAILVARAPPNGDCSTGSPEHMNARDCYHAHGHGWKYLAAHKRQVEVAQDVKHKHSLLINRLALLSLSAQPLPRLLRFLTRPSPSPHSGWQATPRINCPTHSSQPARAVKPFEQPWPVMAMGKAVEEDAAQIVGEEDGKGKLGAEVYSPLVHCVHERLLDGSCKREERARARLMAGEKEGAAAAANTVLNAEAGAEEEADTASSSGGSSTVAGSIHEDQDQDQPRDDTAPSMTSSTASHKPQTPSPFGSCDPAPLLIKNSTPDLIDMEVTVWWDVQSARPGAGVVYDVPPPPSSSTTTSSFPSFPPSSSTSRTWSSAVDVSDPAASRTSTS